MLCVCLLVIVIGGGVFYCSVYFSLFAIVTSVFCAKICWVACGGQRTRRERVVHCFAHFLTFDEVGNCANDQHLFIMKGCNLPH